MHSSKTLLNAAIVILFLYGIGHACECRTLSTEESFREADVVFVGRVLNIEPAGPWERVTFDVTSRSKGDAPNEVTLFQSNSSLDYQFETDRTYYVFASKSDGKLFASRCSGTRVYGSCAYGWGRSKYKYAAFTSVPTGYSYAEMALVTGISVSLSLGIGLVHQRLRARRAGGRKEPQSSPKGE